MSLNNTTGLKLGSKVVLNQSYAGYRPGDTGVVTRTDGGSRNDLTGVKMDIQRGNDQTITCFAYRLDLSKTSKTWTPTPVSRNFKLYKNASSPALRKVGTIRKLLNSGKSVRAIAAKLGLSKSAVGRVAQRIAA